MILYFNGFELKCMIVQVQTIIKKSKKKKKKKKRSKQTGNLKKEKNGFCILWGTCNTGSFHLICNPDTRFKSLSD